MDSKLRLIIHLVLFITTICSGTAIAQSVDRGARAITIPSNDGQSIEFGRYYALAIGNNDYEHLNDLETAIADANAVIVRYDKHFKYYWPNAWTSRS